MSNRGTRHSPTEDFESFAVRGNDNYRLYGEPLAPTNYKLPLTNHTLSVSEETKFLIHEAFRPPLATLDGPVPCSDITRYNDAIQKRLNAPIWERAYELTGDISVSGKRGFVYINGRLFQPSTAEKPPPYQTIWKRGVELVRKKSPKRIECDTVLLVRHTLGHIYFHTYHDLLSKIVWANKLGIDPNIPMVVSAKWARGHYGAHFIKSDLFKGRHVILQEDDQTLLCKKLYWLRTPQFCQSHMDAVANSFEEQAPAIQPGEKLVLLREKKTHDTRLCEGMDELANGLISHGYKRVDPGDFSIPEQKWIFAKATHIVGENGSAFTNAIFRSGLPLTLDSIIPSRSATSTFQALSKAYGFKINSHLVHSRRETGCVRAFLDPKTVSKIMRNAQINGD